MLLQAFRNLFLGQAPHWYKLTIVGFLVLNPLVMMFGGPHGATITAWMVLL